MLLTLPDSSARTVCERSSAQGRDALARLASIHQFWTLRYERRLQRYAWAARHLDDLPQRPKA